MNTHLRDMREGDLIRFTIDGEAHTGIVIECDGNWRTMTALVGDEVTRFTLLEERTILGHEWVILYPGGGTEVDDMEKIC